MDQQMYQVQHQQQQQQQQYHDHHSHHNSNHHNHEVLQSSSGSVWILSLSCASLVGFAGILPFLILPQDLDSSSANLKLMLAFSVGGLLGDVFLHILPEAWSSSQSPYDGLDHHHHHDDANLFTGLWVVMGLIAFTFLEIFFTNSTTTTKSTTSPTSKSSDQSCVPSTPSTISSSSPSSTSSSSCDTQQQQQQIKTNNNINNNNSHNHSNQNNNNNINNNNSIKSTANHRSNSNSRSQKKSCPPSVTNGVAATITTTTTTATTPTANKMMSISNSNSSNSNNNNGCISMTGYLNVMANGIDNFSHGLAVAASFLTGTKIGFVTTFAILMHEVPHEFGDFAILMKSGFNKWQAAKAQAGTASIGLLGAVVALTTDAALVGTHTSWMLPFTAGGFMQIAMVNILPDLMRETDAKESLKQIAAVTAGILVMKLVNCFH